MALSLWKVNYVLSLDKRCDMHSNIASVFTAALKIKQQSTPGTKS
jgi:hypothetical protein